MSDPLRNFTAASEADRNAKIEQLLLAGLDHYFAGQYDHAISVWTRVLFLDRSHARARAYIERARSALAERQRESEELLQSGVAAFKRGDGSEARRLVQAAIDGGAPTDEALAVLDRLNRLEPAAPADSPAPARRPRRGAGPREARASAARSGLTMSLLFVVALAAAAIYSAVVWGPLDWRTLFSLPAPAAATSRAATTREPTLEIPRRGELALTRARTLAAGGHLRDALGALDFVKPTDPQKPEADQLRGEIQRQLIALTSVPAQPGGSASDRPIQ
jgi:tetratricopeptide (TPR) repeat protein